MGVYLRGVLLCVGLLLQVACGFKGDLYQPEDQGNASFGAIQTGINLHAPVEKSPSLDVKNPQSAP